MGIDTEPDDKGWAKFVRRHWKMTLAAAGGVAAATAAAIMVFLWVVADAQATGLAPAGLGAWTVGHVFSFVLTVVLWELILVASWAVPVAVAAFFLWYKRLPEDERMELEGGPKRSRSAGENGGFSLFVGLVWLLGVWIDGRWNLAFQDWTFNDWVYSWIAAFLVALLLVGVPGIAYVLWSLRGRGR